MSTPASPLFKIVGGDGKEYGPIDLETLQQWMREGRVAGQTQIWDSRTGNWQPAAQIAELAGSFPAPAASSGPAAQDSASSAAAPGVELAEQILRRGYTVEIGKWIGEGWKFFKDNLGFVMGAYWAAFGLCICATFVVGPVSFVVQPALIGGLWLILLHRRRGQPTKLGNIFDGFSLFFAQGILVWIISGLLILSTALPGVIVAGIGAAVFGASPHGHVPGVTMIAVGILLATAPVIYLAVGYMFALPLVADRLMQFWPAMETSRRVVSRHWFAMFGLGLVIGLLVLLGKLACCVGVVFTLPLGFCISVVAYEEIFGRPQSAGVSNT